MVQRIAGSVIARGAVNEPANFSKRITPLALAFDRTGAVDGRLGIRSATGLLILEFGNLIQEVAAKPRTDVVVVAGDQRPCEGVDRRCLDLMVKLEPTLYFVASGVGVGDDPKTLPA